MILCGLLSLCDFQQRMRALAHNQTQKARRRAHLVDPCECTHGGGIWNWFRFDFDVWFRYSRLKWRLEITSNFKSWNCRTHFLNFVAIHSNYFINLRLKINSNYTYFNHLCSAIAAPITLPPILNSNMNYIGIKYIFFQIYWTHLSFILFLFNFIIIILIIYSLTIFENDSFLKIYLEGNFLKYIFKFSCKSYQNK